MAKSLLEQISLACQGREKLYKKILSAMFEYVNDDLRQLKEPALQVAERPADDPLEDVLFLTSVGEPSVIYQTVRRLRQARAYRLGALQQKLPDLHMFLLWVLFAGVLFTFPLLGAGSQTIGGYRILDVQSIYISFIVFGMSCTMGTIYELRRPGDKGAYNAMLVLNVMVSGLVEEIDLRLRSEIDMNAMEGPSVDGYGSWGDA